VLHVRNYRLVFFSQLVSISGTSMQIVGQSWLLLQLHGGGLALGLLTVAQFLPVVLLSPIGGLIADRVEKRRLLMVTQAVNGLLALLLATLTETGGVRLWMVMVLGAAAGTVSAIDGPSRQVFGADMVPPELVANSVSLNEVVVNSSRVLGPALGAFVIVHFGTASCFFANAASFVPPIIAIKLIRAGDMHRTAVSPAGTGQLREGARYAWRTPILRGVILLAASSTAIFNFGVSIPLMATRVLQSGAGGYGSMVAAFGVGAVGGAVCAAHDHHPAGRRVRSVALAAGAAVVASGFMPNLATELAAQVVSGLFAIWFYSLANALVLVRATPVLRGRVMGLWSMALAATLPISGPLVGSIAETIGPREALSFGGIGLLVTSVIGWRILGADREIRAPPLTFVTARATTNPSAASEDST
jgi:MFS family permease